MIALRLFLFLQLQEIILNSYAIADKLDEVKDIDFSVDNDEEIGVNRVLYKHTPSR